MKINLDKDNYLEIKLNNNNHISLSIKANKNENSYILVNTILDESKVDELISELVSLKAKLQ